MSEAAPASAVVLMQLQTNRRRTECSPGPSFCRPLTIEAPCLWLWRAWVQLPMAVEPLLHSALWARERWKKFEGRMRPCWQRQDGEEIRVFLDEPLHPCDEYST